MTDTSLSRGLADDPEYLRRVFCYLERCISSDDLNELQRELRAEPLKRTMFVGMCLMRTSLQEKYRKEAEFARDLASDQSAPWGENRDGREHQIRASRHDPFLILLEEAGRGAPRESAAMTPPADRKAGNLLGRARFPSAPSRRRRTWTLAAGILLPLLTGVLLSRYLRDSTPATIAVSVDARLDDGAAPRPLQKLVNGPHTLHQGLMQLSLAGGAKIVLQGPAHFDVVSGSRISLSSGRLTAVVPHGTAGLTVETPNVIAVDLGTEFGVDVNPADSTRVEVFQGRVRAEARSPDGSTSSRTLGTRDAVVISARSSAIQAAAIEPLAFVRPAELVARAQASDPSDYAKWKQFSQRLRDDPDLVAYYPFDNETEDPASLLNRSHATAGQHNGHLGFDDALSSRPTWTTGRWPQKRALRFGDEHPTAVTIPGDTDLLPESAITLAFWIKRSELEDPVHLIYSAVGDKMEFNLAVTGTGSRINPSLKPLSIYFEWESHATALSAPSVLPGTAEWCFIAVTATPGEKTRFYVNGVLRVTRPTRPLHRLGTGDVTIGRPVPHAEADSREIFRGSMDELAIFRRALSADEIRRIYDEGLPH